MARSTRSNIEKELIAKKLIKSNGTFYLRNPIIKNAWKNLKGKRKYNNDIKQWLKSPKVKSRLQKLLLENEVLNEEFVEPLIHEEIIEPVFHEEEYKRYSQQFIDTVYEKLRLKRFFYSSHIMTQEPIIDSPQLYTFTELLHNEEVFFVSNTFHTIIETAHDALYNYDSNVNGASIQARYGVQEFDSKGEEKLIKIKYTKSNTLFNKNTPFNKIKFSVENQASDTRILFLGYRVVYSTTNNEPLNNDTLYNLKAFSESTNRKFHELSVSSTGYNKICIYESFLHIIGERNLRYMRESKKNHDEIMLRLKNEGEEIEKAVKNGELVRSVELLTKKYNKEITIVHFGVGLNLKSLEEKEFNKKQAPININNGITKLLLSIDEINNLIDTECMLYNSKDEHVSVTKFNYIRFKRYEEMKEEQLEKFVLRQPKKLKNYKLKLGGILGFDAETYTDEKDNCVCYCLTVVGKLGKDNINKTFYDNDCIKPFTNYLVSISTKINNNKSRKKVSVPYINIYGFNNSRFDNLLIYNELYKINRSTKFVFVNNGIKYIKFHNLRIFDISCQYKIGTLRETCAAFGLEKEKGVFPYKFVNANNLEYIGKLPDNKFWNSPKERDEYIIQNRFTFNMKEYTIKYCLLDSELVYDLACLHLNNCIGEINGRKYKTDKCMTSANLALSMFQQCFQEEDLHQSPDEIVNKEKLAYKGGRTEVFKKLFKSENDSKLYYYDINSAYPAGMTQLMPYKFKHTINYDNEIIQLHKITDYNLYLAKSKYIGNNINSIPNLLIRSESGDIIGINNSDYAYHWGCEIKEAIKNNYEITIKEENIYEGKAIFKVFSEYFYNERLKIKKTNTAKALFFKNVLNSLYGKFGQKTFNKTCLCNDMSEVMEVLKNDVTQLVDMNIVNNVIMIEYREAGQEYVSIGKLVRFSSYISSTARCKLSEFMRDVGHENVHYCDTDSVFTSKKPSDRLVNQNILGLWKLETEPIVEAVFLAPKCYTYSNEDNETIKKAKGVRADDINVNEYKDLVNGDIKTISKSSLMFFRSYEGVIIRNQERNLTPVYNKRIWNSNNSIPFNSIEEWSNNKI
jgi:hypothetical protein